MWKWLILIVAGYVLYRLFANDLLKKKKEHKEDSAAEVERKVAAGEMVKDPEWGLCFYRGQYLRTGRRKDLPFLQLRVSRQIFAAPAGRGPRTAAQG